MCEGGSRLVGGYNHLCLRPTLVFMWDGAMPEGFNIYFSVVFG